MTSWQLTTYALFWTVAASIAAAGGVILWRQRATRGAAKVALIMLCLCGYALAVALGAVSETVPAKLFWGKCEHIFMAIAPLVWVTFARDYAQLPRLARWQLVLLSAVPAVTVALVWTNEAHGLVWQDTWLEPRAGWSELRTRYGPWMWISLTYAYGAVAGGAIHILQAIRRLPASFRTQATSLLFAALIPLVASIFYVALPTLRTTALVLLTAAWIAIMVWLLMRTRLLRLMPVTQRAVMAQMRDGLIVLDAFGRVESINPSALSLLDVPEPEAIGRSIVEILPEYAAWDTAAGPAREFEGELARAIDGDERFHEVRVVPLSDSTEGPAGQMVVMHDVSDRRRAQESVQRRADELGALQSTVLDITATRELPQLLRAIVERAAQLLATPSGGMYLCNPEARAVHCVVSYNTPRNYTGTVLQYGEGAAGKVAETGQPLIVDNYAVWENRAAAYEDDRPFAAVLSVPMIWQGVVDGVLQVLDTEERHFSERDAELLSLFASHAAIALRNARLMEKVQQELNERTLLEAEIQERRQYLERILASAPDAIVTLDRDQRVVEWNPGAERLFGYSAEEARERKLDDLIAAAPPETRKEAVALTERVIGGQSLAPMEVKRYRKDGSAVFAVLSGSPILVGEKLVGVAAVYTDVTELRSAEEALRASEARYRNLFENSPISLWEEDWSGVLAYVQECRDRGIADLATHLEQHPDELASIAHKIRILDVNRASLELYGASHKHELTADMERVLVPEDRTGLLENALAVAEGRTRFGLELPNRTLSGERKLLQIRVQVVPGHEDTWDRLIVSLIDITERRLAQQRLAASLREKETLLREIHHRVKNNLQVVSSLLYLQALKAEPLGASAILQDSRRQVRSMALVHEKLYAAQDLARIDLDEYVRGLVTSVQQSHGEAAENIAIKTDVSSVALDVDRAIPCGLIINELVSNALKHAFPDSSSGSITVEIHAEGPKCILRIADDGVGLPPGVDAQHTETLGLQLVRTLVEQVQGSLTVKRDAGTCYTIAFHCEQRAPDKEWVP